MKLISLFFYFLIISGNCLSQWISNVNSNALQVCEDSTRRLFDFRPVEDEDGGVIIFTKTGHFNVDSTRSVVAQKIRKDGFLEWGNKFQPKTVLNSVAPDEDLQICGAVKDGSGGAYVLIETVLPYQGLSIKKLVLQHIDAIGNLLWGSNGIQVLERNDSLDNLSINICSTTGGGVTVSWELRVLDTLNFGYEYAQVFLQKYDYSGTPLWIEGGLPVKPNSIIIGNDMIADEAGGIIVFYQEFLSNNSSKVYTQRIDANGTFLWGNGTALSIRTGYQYSYSG